MSRTRVPAWTRQVAAGAIVFAFASILAACSTPRISTIGDKGARPTASGSATSKPVGVDLEPLLIPVFIFGSPTSTPVIQPASRALVRDVGSHDRLRVLALPSGPGTAAIDFLERAPAGQRWGEVMLPVEREVFRDFAGQASLGDHLVMLTDVDVLSGPDPVPMTAYRWSRADVEAYARCGIPNQGFTACTDAFFLRGNARIISTVNLYRGF